MSPPVPPVLVAPAVPPRPPAPTVPPGALPPVPAASPPAPAVVPPVPDAAPPVPARPPVPADPPVPTAPAAPPPPFPVPGGDSVGEHPAAQARHTRVNAHGAREPLTGRDESVMAEPVRTMGSLSVEVWRSHRQGPGLVFS